MSKYNIGDRVRIKSVEQLKDLRNRGADITQEMIEYGGRIVTIRYILPKCIWVSSVMPGYKMKEIPTWTWYENLLEPLE